MEAFDLNEFNVEHQWGAAISQWFDGDSAALTSLIRDPGLSIPDFGREFLVDLASGTVNRGKGGRPAERHGWVERAIGAEFFAKLEAAQSQPRPRDAKNKACEEVAESHGITADAVRGIVDKLRRQGITFDLWIAKNRPDWRKIPKQET